MSICHSKQPDTKSDRLCVICDSKLFGRADKIFCTPRCKNRYHSDVRKTNKTVSKETLKVLYKNYQILSSLKSESCTKYQISKLVLQRKGFDFETITGLETNKFGLKLKLFNFSWYYSNHNTVVIYIHEMQSDISPFVYKRWARYSALLT